MNQSDAESVDSEYDRHLAKLTALLEPALSEVAPGRTHKRTQKRTHDNAILTLRLSLPLKEALKAAAAAQGLSLSDYARLKLSDNASPKRRRVRPPVSNVNRRVLIELNRIGVNLNQRLRQLHRQDIVDVTQADRQLLQHLLEVLGTIQQQIMGAAPADAAPMNEVPMAETPTADATTNGASDRAPT